MMRGFLSIAPLATVLALGLQNGKADVGNPEGVRPLVAAAINETSWPRLAAQIKEWRSLPAAERALIASQLMTYLDDQRFVQLTDLGDLRVIPRQRHSPWHGHGLITNHDIFVVADRARFLIELVLKLGSLPTDDPTLTPGERAARADAVRLAVESYVAAVRDVSSERDASERVGASTRGTR